jgi:hypothetical protein
MIREISAHSGQLFLPNLQKCINSAFSDLKRREMRKEVIANEENEENPVINSLFEVKGEWRLGYVEFDFEILAESCNVEEDERLFLRRGLCYFCLHSSALSSVVSFLPADSARRRTPLLEENILSKYLKIRFMRCQSQHDQVSVLEKRSDIARTEQIIVY